MPETNDSLVGYVTVTDVTAAQFKPTATGGGCAMTGASYVPVRPPAFRY